MVTEFPMDHLVSNQKNLNLSPGLSDFREYLLFLDCPIRSGYIYTISLIFTENLPSLPLRNSGPTLKPSEPNLLHIMYPSGSKSIVLRPGSSPSLLGNLLEMQILGPNSRSTESKTLQSVFKRVL